MIPRGHSRRPRRLAVASALLAVGVHATAVSLAWLAPGARVSLPPVPLDVRFVEEPAPDVLPAPLPVAVRQPRPVPPPPKPVRRKPEPRTRAPVPQEKPVPVPTLVAEAPASPQIPEALPPVQTAAPVPAVLPHAAPAAPPPPPAPAAPAGGAPSVVPPRFDAAYLSNPPPPYPMLSRRLGEEGRVQLRVFVERDGRASKVEMYNSSGFSRLDEAALGAVRNWRFVPAKRGEEAVAAWVLVPINFTLKNS